MTALPRDYDAWRLASLEVCHATDKLVDDNAPGKWEAVG